MTYTHLEISADITACDPGCNHTTYFSGTIAISDLKAGQRVDNLIESEYWHHSAGYKFRALYFVRAEEDRVVLRYGDRECYITGNQHLTIDKQPLDYAYAELYAYLLYLGNEQMTK